MKELDHALPEDVAYDVMYDTTVFVEATIEKVIHTLVEAFVLVGIVVFVFLGNLRATLIPIIAVPVALVGTFAVMLALGFSANTVSLLALVLAIGIVVDDAIVVVEAVEHILETEPDLTPAQATEKAMGQVTGPIIAITLVLLSVFIPTAFIPGIAGQLYKQFAVAVSASMVISAVNALSLSPALCSHPARRTRRAASSRDASASGIDRTRRRLRRAGGASGAAGSHRRPARGGLHRGDRRHGAHRADRVPARRGPGRLHGRDSAARRRLDQSHAGRRRAGRGHIEGKPWLQNLFTVSGYSMLDGLACPTAFFVAAMKPFDERKSPDMSVFAAIRQLHEAFRADRGRHRYPFNLPPIIGLGTSAGFEFQLVSRTGASPADLAATAAGWSVAAKASQRLAGVFTTYGASTPQIYLDLDRERAEILGVQITDVFNALQTAMGGYLRQRLQPVSAAPGR